MSLSFPKIQLSPDGDLYELQAEAAYSYMGLRITVPAGYKYDGASIPRVFWSEIGSPFDPRFMTAALAHDRCYETHEHSKEWVDDLFRETLIACGVSHIKAKAMFDAVKYFGHAYWELPAIPSGGGDA